MGVGEPTQFAEAFEDCRLPQEHAKVAMQLKHLVTPAGIGEIFQVLLLSHGVDAVKSALSERAEVRTLTEPEPVRRWPNSRAPTSANCGKYGATT